MIKTVIGAMTALSLATVPAMASAANPASSLSVSNARVGTTTSGKSKAAGGGVIAAVAIVAGVAAIGIVAATKDDKPTSR